MSPGKPFILGSTDQGHESTVVGLSTLVSAGFF